MSITVVYFYIDFQGLEDEEMYTDEEFEEYERQQREWMEANHAQAGEINVSCTGRCRN